MSDTEKVPEGQILLAHLNTILRGCGVKRQAADLVNLIGIIGLRVLALEASR